MRPRLALATLAVLTAVGLLALALALTPGGVAEAQPQPTAQTADDPLLPPLTLFLIKPTPEFAAVLSSLKITPTQGQGLAGILTEETQLLREAAARGTLALDAGPIGQNTWRRLQGEALTPEQYATLRDWAVANRRLALQTLQEAASGASPLATPMPTANGTPSPAPEIGSLVATAQASPAATGAASQAAMPAATAGAAGVAVVAQATTGAVAAAGVAVAQAATPAATDASAATAAATTAPTAAPTMAPTTAATAAPTTVPTTAPTTAPTAAATTAVAPTRAPVGSPTPTAATGAAGSTTGTPTATAGRPGSITVIGMGRAAATPNVAHVMLGVEATADTVRQAATEANTKTAAIIAKLKSLGVADKDIQTSQYSIFPVREGNGPVQAAGAPAAPTATPKPQFRVNSTVNVTIRDLNNVGPAIDGAIEAGANVAGGIQFSVDDPTPLTDQARGNAVNDAHRQAQQIAQAAGVTLGPPVIITEVIGSAVPQLDAVAGAARAVPAAAPPPIQGGELTFTQQIQITYEMHP